MRDLRNSADPGEQEAARRLQDVFDDVEDYDVMIVHSRPNGKSGYGEGMDGAVEGIRDGGSVGNIDVVDVVRPR
jgi:hypothetical protein